MKLFSEEAIKKFYLTNFVDLKHQSPYFSIDDVIMNLDAIPPSYIAEVPENANYRPCYIDTWQREHQKALFHKWVANPITRQDGVTIMQTLALVEFEDGTVARIEAKGVRFDDSKRYFDQFIWTEEVKDDARES